MKPLRITAEGLPLFKEKLDIILINEYNRRTWRQIVEIILDVVCCSKMRKALIWNI